MMLQIGQEPTEIAVAKLLLTVTSLKHLLEIDSHAGSLTSWARVLPSSSSPSWRLLLASQGGPVLGAGMGTGRDSP